MSITLKKVSKRFGDFYALRDIDLEVPSGGLVALLGPSGCGKTTLLRVIAGLETPTEGSVLYREEDITDRSVRERNVGFVFQHYALFRHMNVYENIAFALRVRGWSEDWVRARVRELVELIRLERFERMFPAQLSGGQRQRVALARALAAEPGVLLLDEPFGALDAKVRQQLRHWLRRLHDEIHMTAIIVTHDQEEAFEVAQRVVVMQNARIEQIGTPQEVFEHPANAFVMDFLGHVNIFHGRAGEAFLRSLDHPIPEEPEEGVAVYVRPHELEISREPGGAGSLPAVVRHIHPAGAIIRVHLSVPDFDLLIQADIDPEKASRLALKPGDEVVVSPQRLRVFPRPRTGPPPSA